ncbi:MAG: hypothetical protein WCT27_01315 [Patescibacteria group bacterium]|jgi:hypothetical protein
MEQLTTHSKNVRLFFFWAGIIATFAYRIIVVLNYINSAWAQVAWYVGTIGFVAYFIHRFQISEKRSRIIRDYELMKKTDSLPLPNEDRQAMKYIFGTLQSSKERWNYIFIFIISGLALITGVILDFIVR